MDFLPHIEVVCGPMYSGKTSELLRRVRRYGYAKRRVLVIKYAKDTRYTDADEVSSHDRVMIPARACTTLMQLLNEIDDIDVIGIDEGQFFEDIVEFADEAANRGKIVIVSCLDGDFRRQPWKVLNLIPLAEKVDKLNAICVKCCSEAPYSHRSVKDESRELIGGAEAYMPLCRSCYVIANNPELTKPSELAVQSTPAKRSISQSSSPGSDPMAIESPM